MNAIQTKHNLDFLAAPWHRDESITVYKVGTCHGQYCFTSKGLELISIVNDDPHNGHIDDVFEWFEFSARVNKVNLYIRSFFNERFRNHCINKRGFKPTGNDGDLVKIFKLSVKERLKLTTSQKSQHCTDNR